MHAPLRVTLFRSFPLCHAVSRPDRPHSITVAVAHSSCIKFTSSSARNGEKADSFRACCSVSAHHAGSPASDPPCSPGICDHQREPPAGSVELPRIRSHPRPSFMACATRASVWCSSSKESLVGEVLASRVSSWKKTTVRTTRARDATNIAAKATA